MKTSTFLPAVTVGDDGTIEVDWNDAYADTFDSETGDTESPDEFGAWYDHARLLDAILDSETDRHPADRLERLVAYLRARPAARDVPAALRLIGVDPPAFLEASQS